MNDLTVLAKFCIKCGMRSVPAQSFCPGCGTELPAAVDAPPEAASAPLFHKLILNKDGLQKTYEFATIEEAFHAATEWVVDGCIARITDTHGVVKYTLALSNGQIATYGGDVTERSKSQDKKPWWKF